MVGDFWVENQRDVEKWEGMGRGESMQKWKRVCGNGRVGDRLNIELVCLIAMLSELVNKLEK